MKPHVIVLRVFFKAFREGLQSLFEAPEPYKHCAPELLGFSKIRVMFKQAVKGFKSFFIFSCSGKQAPLLEPCINIGGFKFRNTGKGPGSFRKVLQFQKSKCPVVPDFRHIRIGFKHGIKGFESFFICLKFHECKALIIPGFKINRVQPDGFFKSFNGFIKPEQLHKS